MNLTVPKDFAGDILDSDGVKYLPVNGVVDIPEDRVTANLWGFGFERVIVVIPSYSKPAAVVAEAE